MILYYVVSNRPLPPTPESLLSAIRARKVWRDLQPSKETGPVWDELHLVDLPHEALVHFTVGSALPAVVLEWTQWAAGGLSAAEKQLLQTPSATYRIEMPQPRGGAMEVAGPGGLTRIEAEPSVKDAARRGAQLGAAVAAEISVLVEGVLVDVPGQRFWSPADVERFTQAAFDVRDYVTVHAELQSASAEEMPLLFLHTHGLMRFGRPDVEMGDVPRDMLGFGTHVLNEVSHHQALGNVVKNGETVLVDEDYAFSVSSTSRSRLHCGNDVIALADPMDVLHRDAHVPRFTLARFAEDVADDLLGKSDLAGAHRWLTLSVTLAPYRAVAWRKRAAVNEHLSRPGEAASDLARAADAEQG